MGRRAGWGSRPRKAMAATVARAKEKSVGPNGSDKAYDHSQNRPADLYDEAADIENVKTGF